MHLNNCNIYNFTLNANQNDVITIYLKIEIQRIIMEIQLRYVNCLLIHIDNDICVLRIYRSPSTRDISPFLHSLDEALIQLRDVRNVYLIGNININIPNTGQTHQQADINYFYFIMD